MEIIKTAIDGPLIIEPHVFRDERGYFFESFSQREFDEKVFPVQFVQDNESMSSYGVMRGLHYQRMPYTQSKLVRCVKGAVLDVAVDIRWGSPTFGQHVAVELTEENHRQFFVPRGFAHGFAVLSKTAVFQYKCDNFYHPEADAGINIKDASLNIDWRIPVADALLSQKDLRHANLADAPHDFLFTDELY
ncbi:MAG: dTDP-4-dehydrorhamnose 3,5-epimerase [Bacteroidales bacterium]|nr:dTDP-4-dehydrorhamnose 3,5-epimerase [Candidatus Physcousia equi]